MTRNHSTAGKVRLGVITRAGDEALRSVMVVGATAVIQQARRGGRASHWLAARPDPASYRPCPRSPIRAKLSKHSRAVELYDSGQTATEVDHTFFDRYLATYIRPVQSDDAVRQAIKEGEASLANLKSPMLAVMLSKNYLRSSIAAEVAKRLPLWTKYQPVSFGKPTAHVGAQRIEVLQPFKTSFSKQGITADGVVTVLATGAGAQSGRFRPQIEDIQLTKFHYNVIGDLPGVIIGVNRIFSRPPRKP